MTIIVKYFNNTINYSEYLKLKNEQFDYETS